MRSYLDLTNQQAMFVALWDLEVKSKTLTTTYHTSLGIHSIEEMKLFDQAYACLTKNESKALLFRLQLVYLLNSKEKHRLSLQIVE